MVNVFNYMDNFIFVISLNRKIKFTNKAVMNKFKRHHRHSCKRLPIY